MTAVRSVVMGCDPGLSGACAALDETTNQIIAVYDMPLLTPDCTGQAELNSDAFAEILERHDPRLIMLELVQGFGYASSGFKLGASYGGIIVRAAASRFRLERVRPRTWQKLLPRVMLGDDTKAASIDWATKQHPEANLIRRGKKPCHDRADAVNLAVFGSLTYPIGKGRL